MSLIKKHIKKDTLANRLVSYKLLNLFLRVVIIAILALVLLRVIIYLSYDNDLRYSIPPLKYHLIIVIAFVLAAEIQIAVDNLMERIMPVPNLVRLRLAIQIVLGLFVIALVFKIIVFIIEPDLITINNNKVATFMGLMIGLIFVFMVAHGLILARFTEKWAASQRKFSEMKREKLKMDYNILQDQLNPHFLFNNLSVLKSLIIYDQNTAVTFTENFTDVYRYVLKSKDKRLVKLEDELVFIESFIGLHKERLGESLEVKFSINKDSVYCKLPPLTLQLLVENAIKHNIADKESPLLIEIISNKDYLIVRNNFQPRETSYSTKTGLHNLMKRYDMLTNNKINISSDNEVFEIHIPLLT